MNKQDIPIIVIDGPSGSGKGTIAQLIAHRYGWHYLDSGALYRLLALQLLEQFGGNLSDGIEQEINKENLIEIATALDVKFHWDREQQKFYPFLANKLVSNKLRSERCSQLASKIAVIPEIRQALIHLQHSFVQKPGLVAEGRDMGTVVFPWAKLKLFLTANVMERANRRLQQLQEQGENAKFFSLLQELKKRDERDQNRAVAPLKPATDALVIDSSKLSIDQVVKKVTKLVNKFKLLD